MNENNSLRGRILSIDILRGLVMIFMSLDHVRVYFTDFRFQPENMNQTYLAMFLTRWVTHFCAPVFFLLAGMGIWFYVSRELNRTVVTRFLVTRGLWLVFLELAVIGFFWSFLPGFNFAGVIWALGWSMVTIGLMIRIPFNLLMAIGLLITFGHHLFDSVEASALGPVSWVWNILHVPGWVRLPFMEGRWFVLYPLIPSVGVMILGYGLGRVMSMSFDRRQKYLILIGVVSIILFVVLRVSNFYGSPVGRPGFVSQESIEMNIIAFLNADKYPFSVQFILMTLGPALLLLALFDRLDEKGKLGTMWPKISVYGRVPMFYYLQHLFLIHIVAIATALLYGQGIEGLIAKALPFTHPGKDGYGHGLLFIYVLTIVLNGILYFSCIWYDRLKSGRSKWWLSYL